MTVPEYLNSSCMRLGTIKKYKTRRQRKLEPVELSARKRIATELQKTFGKTFISELIFDICNDCARMSIIPQGAFAACKVRDNLQRGIPISGMDEKEHPMKENIYNSRPLLEGWELTPLKYNSKLMNSIWGLYNRYSVHNFKKNTDSEDGFRGAFAAAWDVVENRIPAANAVASVATSKNS